MNTREAYIALNMMSDIGPVGVRALAALLGSPEAILQATAAEMMRADGIGAAQAESIAAQCRHAEPGREIKRAQKLGYRIITPADEDYPVPLRAIHDPPLALYVWGSLGSDDRRALAVVGSRHATVYGRETAEMLACRLAQTGFTVVSGLARGIDTAAHRGALRGGGRTLAVLGGALDCLYPEENRALAEKIAQQGAVLSEFPLGRQPDKTTFPMRNRIVSGLSMGVLVVEAGLQSGALITVNQALDQGRCVFAVPGRIDSPASRGAHQLLKTGARLVENVEDILQEFEFLIPPQPQTGSAAPSGPKLTENEATILAILEEGERDFDTLVRLAGLAASEISVLILGLEMKRLVRMLPGRLVELRRL